MKRNVVVHWKDSIQLFEVGKAEQELFHFSGKSDYDFRVVLDRPAVDYNPLPELAVVDMIARFKFGADAMVCRRSGGGRWPVP